jgi:hypothetical protein
LRKRRWIRVALAGGASGLCLYVSFGMMYDICMYRSANWLYKQAFGVSPEKDVQILESAHVLAVDYSWFSLKFRISKRDLGNLIAGRLSEVTRSAFENDANAGNVENDWFRGSVDRNASVFYKGTKHGDSRCQVRLAYNDIDQVAYFLNVHTY